MKNVTDIKEIKEMAKVFLLMDIEETKFPFIATHPFTNSFYCVLEGKMTDLHDEENAKLWRQKVSEEIDKVDLNTLFLLINKPYILSFIKYIEQYISAEDLGTILCSRWQSIENISLDKSVAGKEIVSWFKRASKETLMREDSQKIYKSLPPHVKIYRGVTEYNKKNKKALSWTTDKEIAKWFAERYDTGTGEIWSTIVPKESVLCVFNGREKELIVDMYGKNNKNLLIEKV